MVTEWCKKCFEFYHEVNNSQTVRKKIVTDITDQPTEWEENKLILV